MRISAEGLDLIKTCEGFRDCAYRDGSGVWTIAWGHTEGVREGDRCDGAQGEAWLVRDVARAEAAVRRQIAVPLSQRQFDALVSFAFNIGPAALAGSTLRRKLDAGDYAGAADEFPRWVHDATGAVVPGLVRRRALERALFLDNPQGATTT
ncbi:lysozyme [Enhydrobacter sp.]|jgi:lysozyme|uniref:lysozyme n=1 Tax=Enhydrobacter sp. TaxID=1894999 RepID=UPI002620CEE0|nr:lysozyme [Enhydrobacter sp.]WIM14478.1 MAG: Phage lysozyme R [Enhydrobacter sp.]